MTDKMILTPTAMGSTPDKRNDYWATPTPLFDWLNSIFEFDVDVCATDDNHKCDRYFTEAIDGLKQKWEGSCFMNPPYSTVATWMEKAWIESEGRGADVLCLVPASTETVWHRTAVHRALGDDASILITKQVDHLGKEWTVLKSERGEVWTSPYRIQFEHPDGVKRKSGGNPKGSTIFVFYGSQEA